MIVFWELWTASETLSVSHCFGYYLFLVLLTGAVSYSLVYFLCLKCLLESKEGIQPNFLFPFNMLSITLGVIMHNGPRLLRIFF